MFREGRNALDFRWLPSRRWIQNQSGRKKSRTRNKQTWRNHRESSLKDICFLRPKGVSGQKPDHFRSLSGPPPPRSPRPRLRPSLSQPSHGELCWRSGACSGSRNHLWTRLTRCPAMSTPATSGRRDSSREGGGGEKVHSLGGEN